MGYCGGLGANDIGEFSDLVLNMFVPFVDVAFKIVMALVDVVGHLV